MDDMGDNIVVRCGDYNYIKLPNGIIRGKKKYKNSESDIAASDDEIIDVLCDVIINCGCKYKKEE